MKKLSKSVLIITVVTALLFAVAVTALAASWSESGTFSGHAYSGDYYVTMSLTDDKASARLEVSNYKGIIEVGGGAEIDYTIYGIDGKFLYKDTVKVEGTSCSFTYNAQPGDQPFGYLTCEFKYFGFMVTNYVLDLN